MKDEKILYTMRAKNRPEETNKQNIQYSTEKIGERYSPEYFKK